MQGGSSGDSVAGMQVKVASSLTFTAGADSDRGCPRDMIDVMRYPSWSFLIQLHSM